MLSSFVSWPVSGVVQVPRRCPGQCQGSAEISLLSLKLRVSQGAPIGDFLLAPACPIEKVTLWEGGSEIDAVLQKTKFLPELEIEPGIPRVPGRVCCYWPNTDSDLP